MSFATYASQFLTRQPPESSTTQPLFFSFTTDDSAHLDVDDDADPHLRHEDDEDDEDPYLRLDEEPRVESPPGWLAHQRSPSPSPPPLPPRLPPPRSPPPPPESLSMLTDSLLPRADVFSLPDPHRRRKPLPDAPYAAAFLTALSLCAIASVLSLFLVHIPAPPALLHTIPLLTFLTLLSAVLAYTHLLLLRFALRPVLLLSALLPPLALFLSATLAFAGSFASGGWPLRLFALLPLALAALAVQRLPAELHRAHRSPRLLALTTATLARRTPLLLLLSPLLLLAALLLSLPALTLLVRLPLLHSLPAGLAAGVTALTLLLMHFVARAVQRAAVAGVVGAWYFAYVPPPPPPPATTANPSYYPRDLDPHVRILYAALHRPLGTLVRTAAFALALSFLQLISFLLRWLPMALPYRLVALVADAGVRWVARVGERIGGGRMTGVYCGLTGVGFSDGVGRVRVLTGDGVRPPPLLPLPRPYTLALPFALIAYLRAAGDHEGEGGPSAGYPAALMVALLAGAVCAAVSVFCVGLVRDCADTLYMCHRIDHTAGESRGARTGEGREEIWGAFDPSPAEMDADTEPPRDPETGYGGFNFGNFGLGGLGRLGGGPLPPPRADEPAYMRAHAEEPPYVRARRTSEEENRKVPPPEAYSVSPDAYSARMERSAYSARDEPSRGPHSSQDFIHPHPQAHPDSDSDSLDEGGGESSGMFPGSGFF